MVVCSAACSDVLLHSSIMCYVMVLVLYMFTPRCIEFNFLAWWLVSDVLRSKGLLTVSRLLFSPFTHTLVGADTESADESRKWQRYSKAFF